ncbi:unnamed protein product [Linum trigynum]|uniref:Uncharacterized protein n=1 Tax=Linum trigynum TaxID=586398 RepID=A0AAV2DV91_9ROSI
MGDRSLSIACPYICHLGGTIKSDSRIGMPTLEIQGLLMYRLLFFSDMRVSSWRSPDRRLCGLKKSKFGVRRKSSDLKRYCRAIQTWYVPLI